MNYLIICLDSCRYDKFKNARTSNFNKVGNLQKVYSIAGFTPPAIFGFMMNHPQYNANQKCLISGIPRMTLKWQTCWLPEELKKMGYFTAFITQNPWIFKYKWVFGRGIDLLKGLEFNHVHAEDKIIDEDIKIFKTVKKPKFVFNLFMATHAPRPRGFEGSIELVDKEFGRLLPHLSNTEVIICADHGELDGEGGGKGHNPAVSAVFHPKLFEVPFVRGVIK